MKRNFRPCASYVHVGHGHTESRHPFQPSPLSRQMTGACWAQFATCEIDAELPLHGCLALSLDASAW